MNNFKNMKIEVNAEQPLEEIIKTLESKGYKKDMDCKKRLAKCVFSYTDGTYIVWSINVDKYFPLTTLAELKEM